MNNLKKIHFLQDISQPATRKQEMSSAVLREEWNLLEGSKVFDVKSEFGVKKCVKEGYCFDNTFYEDQKMEGKLRMMSTKVTKEFAQAEVSRLKREATAWPRRVSAFADFSTANFQEDEETSEHEPITEEDLDFSTFSEPDLNSATYSSRSSFCSFLQVEKSNKAVQSDQVTYGDVPVHVKNTIGKHGTLVEPTYLEAMSLLMSENMSVPEAIKAVHIVDTKIWGQTQHLPLELDKQYTKSLSKLKKLQGKTSASLASILDANKDDETPEEVEQKNMMIEMLPENLEDTELNKLKKTINQ